MRTKRCVLSFLAFFILGLNIGLAQEELKDYSQFEFGSGINPFAILDSYPSFPFFANVNYKQRIGIELGVGPVFMSELSNLDQEYTHHKGGVSTYGELDYFFLKNRLRPFIGVGYSYLRSNFEVEFVVKKQEGTQYYFQNVHEDFKTTIQSFYIPVGLRIYLLDDWLYLEPGFRVSFVKKNVDFSDLSGLDIRRNEKVAGLGDEYEYPMSGEVIVQEVFSSWDYPIIVTGKIGFIFFRK